MSNNYPDPPRTDWAELALLSEASDPEEYRDIHGAVIDDENWRRLKEQVIVPFDTYADIPNPGPFDGAKAEDLQSNVVFRWDETAGEWIALNTGTSANPVPGTSHFESVEADEGRIGKSARNGKLDVRELVSNVDKSDATPMGEGPIRVPQDFDTIEAALETVPIYLRHVWDIEVDPVNYTAEEDLLIHTIIATDTAGDRPDTPRLKITTQGDFTNSADRFDIGGVMVMTCFGAPGFQLFGARINDTHPLARDIGVGITSTASDYADMRGIEFDLPSGAGAAFEVDGGSLKLQNDIDFGTSATAALRTKDGSVIRHGGGQLTGTVETVGFGGNHGRIVLNDSHNLTVTNREWDIGRDGGDATVVVDKGEWILPDTVTARTDLPGRSVRVRSAADSHDGEDPEILATSGAGTGFFSNFGGLLLAPRATASGGKVGIATGDQRDLQLVIDESGPTKIRDENGNLRKLDANGDWILV